MFSERQVSEDLLAGIGEFGACSVMNFRNVDENYHIAIDVDALVISGSAARIFESKYRGEF